MHDEVVLHRNGDVVETLHPDRGAREGEVKRGRRDSTGGSCAACDEDAEAGDVASRRDVFELPALERARAASETASASRACAPVPCSGARPVSTESTNAAISGPQGRQARRGPTPGRRRAGRGAGRARESLAPMLPPSSAGAALNAYSATPPSARTRTLLENGYARGIAIEPSAIAVQHRRTRRARGRGRAPARARTRAAASREASSSDRSRGSAGRPGRRRTSRGSPIQSVQSAGGESRMRRDRERAAELPAASRRCSSTYSGQKRRTSRP